MKVLMINHFPLAGSGSGTYTKNLAVHLASIGHEVCIILPENTADYAEVPGIRLHPVFFTPDVMPADVTKVCETLAGEISESGAGKLGDSMETPLPFNFPCFTSHPRSIVTFADLDDAAMKLYTGAFTKAIEEEIENNRPDIIHGQHVWILPSLAVGYGIPLVLTAHGTDLMGYDKWPGMRHFAEKAIEASASVISISQDNLDLLNERFPAQTEKFVRMRNGYDPGVFYPENITRQEVLAGYGVPEEAYEGRKIVSFAGKLANFKGVDVLLDAVKIYEDQEPATLTLIVGDGDEREKLHAQAKDLALKHVRFLGNVNQEALRHLYNIADVSLVPSRREPFGLVAIEAMACGIPVIATNQGGLPDFVNESVGALVEPENEKDLAETIIRTLKREDACDLAAWRKEIAGYAREHYAQDKIIQELDELYKKAL